MRYVVFNNQRNMILYVIQITLMTTSWYYKQSENVLHYCLTDRVARFVCASLCICLYEQTLISIFCHVEELHISENRWKGGMKTLGFYHWGMSKECFQRSLLSCNSHYQWRIYHWRFKRLCNTLRAIEGCQYSLKFSQSGITHIKIY